MNLLEFAVFEKRITDQRTHGLTDPRMDGPLDGRTKPHLKFLFATKNAQIHFLSLFFNHLKITRFCLFQHPGDQATPIHIRFLISCSNPLSLSFAFKTFPSYINPENLIFGHFWTLQAKTVTRGAPMRPPNEDPTSFLYKYRPILWDAS